MAGNSSCLGIYFDDNIIKYARLEKNNSGSVVVKNHSVKFVKDQSIQDALIATINEANAMDIPVVISTPSVKYSDFKILKQISNADRNNIINLEFEEWCDKNVKNIEEYSYVQNVSDVVQEEHYSGVIAIASKADVNKFQEIGPKTVSAMYPYELTVASSGGVDEPNYILVNLDKSLVITSIINSKKVETNIFDVGMGQILDSFTDLVGTYTKSYEACKQINVFTDSDVSTNKVQFEQIVEPVLQEVLQKTQEVVNRYRTDISKIYITGMGTLFTNIDTLFTEYFNMRAEIFKPKFISEVENVRDMSEVLEALPAISLAKYYLQAPKESLDFIKNQNKVTGNFLDKVKALFINSKKNAKKKKFVLDWEKVEIGFAYPTCILIAFVIGYNVFTNLYVNKIDDYITGYNSKISDYKKTISDINADNLTISTSAGNYKKINDDIAEKIRQVQNNEVGKYTTYNVANFTQKLAKIVPKDLVLTYIESDDKKHVTIEAKATNYPSIGYFVANLRLNSDILTNVEVKQITNGSTIVVKIGGDLP